MEGCMRIIADFFSKLMKKYMPNAYIFAVLLTFIVVIAALFVKNPHGESNSLLNVVTYWGNGFWGLLGFAMQMALIVATGTALSTTSSVTNILEFISNKLDTPTKAIVGTAFFTAIACWLQYGFGLIFGALLARKIAVRIRTGLHYPLLVAAAYSGFLVWHGGLSGSIPLIVATPGGDPALVKIFGQGASISLTQTTFGHLNIAISLAMLIAIPLTCYLMMPKEKDIVVLSDEVIEEIKKEEKSHITTTNTNLTMAQKLENSKIITFLTCLLGFGFIISYLLSGKGLSLNIVLFIFLFLGLALHKTPINYLNAFKDGVKETSGILLQFPFYAGIMGIMVSSGLGLAITEFFVNIATPHTLPLYTFFVSGIVNFFIPSGGGQWAVQSQFVLDAAHRLNSNIPNVIMAVSWGDAWTNMVQPFWALPLLSVAKLDVRDILGYTTPILIVSGIIISGLILIF